MGPLAPLHYLCSYLTKYVVVIRRKIPPKQNLTKDELSSLKKIKGNKKIIILRVDKGNAMVVMDKEEYSCKKL
jgi:hypothetical protein